MKKYKLTACNWVLRRYLVIQPLGIISTFWGIRNYVDHHHSPHKIPVKNKQSLFSEPPAPFQPHPFPLANKLVSGDRSYVTRAFVLIKGAPGAVQLTRESLVCVTIILIL